MGLYLRGSVWYYRFWINGVRYKGSTKTSDERKARSVFARAYVAVAPEDYRVPEAFRRESGTPHVYRMTCPICSSTHVFYHGCSVTLVRYSSPVGHDHDDNCRIHSYSCEKGHRWTERLQNTCQACEWKGKTECFCHPLGIQILEPKSTGSEQRGLA